MDEEMDEEQEKLKIDKIKRKSDRKRSLNGRKFATAGQLKKGIEKYFDDCEKNNCHFQMLGLYLSLGICREVGGRYMRGLRDDKKNDFSSLLKIAKDLIEVNKTEKALSGKVPMPIAIFDLKANHERLEVSRQELTGPDGAELIPAINFNFHSDSKDSDN